MLRLFRKQAKVVLWVLIIAFVFWGTGTGIKGLLSRDYRGKIYGRKVSAAEFVREKNALVILAMLRGERVLERNIDSAIWDRIMLLEEAKRLGLTVSSSDIARTIRSIPAFMPGGSFSTEAFRWYLGNWRIPPADFELMIADSILTNKLRLLVISTVLISDGEVREMYGEENEKVSIRYALFPPLKQREDIEVNDEEILSYYSGKAEGFKLPEKVSIAYILIEPEKPEIIAPPADEEIEQFYQSNPERFRHGRRVKLRQILVKVPPEEEEKEVAKVESKLRKIQVMIGKGKDFAKLAKRYSEDERTASLGGELGYMEAGQLEEKLSEVAFSIEPGEIKGPIETGSGYCFIKLEDIQEPGIKEIGEVREKIAGILKREREIQISEDADDRSSQKALALSLALIDDPDLSSIAGKNGIPLRKAGPFSRKEIPEDLPRELAGAAFDIAVGDISDPISIPRSGYAILTVTHKEEERTPPLSEIREEVIESYVTTLAGKKAKEQAEESLEKIKQLMEEKEIDFKSACSEIGIETTASPPFSSMGNIPGLGPSMSISKEAFSLPLGEPSPVIETEKGFVLFAPERIIKADFEPLDKNKDRFKQRYLRQKQQLTWLEWFKNSQARAGIKDFSSLEKNE